MLILPVAKAVSDAQQYRKEFIPVKAGLLYISSLLKWI